MQLYWTFLVCLVVLAVCTASPLKTEGRVKPPMPPEGPQLVYGLPPGTSSVQRDKLGQYAQEFKDTEGTEVGEEGSLLSTNEGWEYVIVKKGHYSYISPEGQHISVRYIADHNGFRILP